MRTRCGGACAWSPPHHLAAVEPAALHRAAHRAAQLASGAAAPLQLWRRRSSSRPRLRAARDQCRDGHNYDKFREASVQGAWCSRGHGQLRVPRRTVDFSRNFSARLKSKLHLSGFLPNVGRNHSIRRCERVHTLASNFILLRPHSNKLIRFDV